MSRQAEPDWARFAPIVAAKAGVIDLSSRGRLVGIKGIAHASASFASKNVATQIAEAARFRLSSLQTTIDIATEYSQSKCAGGGMTLWAIFSDSGEMEDATRIAASSLLGRAATPQAAGEEAAAELLSHIKSDCAIDPYHADQMIPWLALADGGVMATKITPHIRTNIWVVEQFLGKKFVVENDVVRRV
jgi:RNA 3'-terminal phosphate cyclase (GTP)